MTDIVDELKWRGLFALSTDEDALRKALADGPVTFYCGFDPTAASPARRPPGAGAHHAPAPAGRAPAAGAGRRGHRSDRRPAADRRAHAERPGDGRELGGRGCARQIEPFLSFEGENAAIMVNNLDWTAGLSAIEFLRDIGKHFRVNKMLDEGLGRPAAGVRRRASATPSSATRSCRAWTSWSCTGATAAPSSRAAATSGATSPRALDLIHRLEPDAEVHALATPLMTKADGTKFGKTESGAVWLDPEMTTPYAFYQFWLNVDDRDISKYMRILSFRSREELEELERQTEERPQARAAQRALAEELTTLVHGADQMRRRDRRVEGAVRPGRAGRAGRARRWPRRCPSCRTPGRRARPGRGPVRRGRSGGRASRPPAAR